MSCLFVVLNANSKLFSIDVHVQQLTVVPMETESDPSVGFMFGSVSYLASFYGYDKPTVDVTLKYPLPPTAVRQSSRTVKYDGRYYTIWSPNSDYVPYYPGTLAPPRDDGRLDLPPADERRWDGQLGPNDPTISPQYYDPTAPWLPLVTRDNEDPLFVGDSSVAWSRVYDIWETDPDSYEGRLDPHFIDMLKREHTIVDNDIQEEQKNLNLRRDVRCAGIFTFSPADVDGLRRIRRYDHAVILVRRAQRALLKKKAWLEMASAWMRVCKFLQLV